MAYTKTQWANDTAPAINANNLGNIEDGIYAVFNILGINVNSWNSATTYNENDIVIYNNKLYINTTGTSTSTNPASDTTNWNETTILVD